MKKLIFFYLYIAIILFSCKENEIILERKIKCDLYNFNIINKRDLSSLIEDILNKARTIDNNYILKGKVSINKDGEVVLDEKGSNLLVAVDNFFAKTVGNKYNNFIIKYNRPTISTSNKLPIFFSNLCFCFSFKSTFFSNSSNLKNLKGLDLELSNKLENLMKYLTNKECVSFYAFSIKETQEKISEAGNLIKKITNGLNFYNPWLDANPSFVQSLIKISQDASFYLNELLTISKKKEIKKNVKTASLSTSISFEKEDEVSKNPLHQINVLKKEIWDLLQDPKKLFPSCEFSSLSRHFELICIDAFEDFKRVISYMIDQRENSIEKINFSKKSQENKQVNFTKEEDTKTIKSVKSTTNIKRDASHLVSKISLPNFKERTKAYTYPPVPSIPSVYLVNLDENKKGILLIEKVSEYLSTIKEACDFERKTFSSLVTEVENFLIFSDRNKLNSAIRNALESISIKKLYKILEEISTKNKEEYFLSPKRIINYYNEIINLLSKDFNKKQKYPNPKSNIDKSLINSTLVFNSMLDAIEIEHIDSLKALLDKKFDISIDEEVYLRRSIMYSLEYILNIIGGISLKYESLYF